MNGLYTLCLRYQSRVVQNCSCLVYVYVPANIWIQINTVILLDAVCLYVNKYENGSAANPYKNISEHRAPAKQKLLHTFNQQLYSRKHSLTQWIKCSEIRNLWLTQSRRASERTVTIETQYDKHDQHTDHSVHYQIE